MTPITLLFVASAGMSSGCDNTDLGRSCGGEFVLACGPQEWAEISDAQLGPPRLTIADFAMRAQVHVELMRCADAPAAHEVEITVLVPDGEPAEDGGVPVRVTQLVTVVDGEGGDAVAGDGVIDVDIANPFVATIPADTDVTLRFVARSTTARGCSSGTFELPYHTGPPRP